MNLLFSLFAFFAVAQKMIEAQPDTYGKSQKNNFCDLEGYLLGFTVRRVQSRPKEHGYGYNQNYQENSRANKSDEVANAPAGQPVSDPPCLRDGLF